ncbi:hypothetical protein M5K25_004197 [Dendrobium thyrsiflorum]|uniref:Dof zinc finger protein n=1 Tax=Dendrobium thyrsiflorum TaxID=117978 RepID=A0ABD0VSZ4_DENTH
MEWRTIFPGLVTMSLLLCFGIVGVVNKETPRNSFSSRTWCAWMEITNGHQYQTMTSYTLNEVVPVLSCLKASVSSPYQLHEEINPSPKFQSQSESQQALKCPRCDSLNTKFCYYNNYSLSQPRYFCKSCRRYWTKGGSLRNIPIGRSALRLLKKIRSWFITSRSIDMAVGELFLSLLVKMDQLLEAKYQEGQVKMIYVGMFIISNVM